MNVFLIQTNGREISENAAPEYIRGAKGTRYVDEPLQYHRYFNANPYWKQDGYGRRDAWECASAGDTALLYCTSSVEEHGKSLSHVLPIADKRIDEDGAVLEFETAIELDPKLTHKEIQELIDDGKLSESMRYCGQQGFNFTQVEESDLEAVKELSQPIASAQSW